MTTIRLNINEKILGKVLRILRNFKKEDIEIIREDEYFIQNKQKLECILHHIESGEEKLLSQSEFDAKMNEVRAKPDH